MNYDAIYFYDKNTSNIIYVEGPIINCPREMPRPTEIEIADRFGKDIMDIESIELSHEDFYSIIKHVSDKPDTSIIGINYNNGDPLFIFSEPYGSISYNDIEDEKNKHEFSVEKIQELYNYYTKNLEKILLLKNTDKLKLEFIDITKVEVDQQLLQSVWIEYMDNNYILDSFDDRSKIGIDIRDNGMMFPFVTNISYIDGQEQRVTSEGTHRNISINILNKSNGWDGRKLLSISGKDINRLKSQEAVVNDYLETPIRVVAPYIVRYYDMGYDAIGSEELEKDFLERNTIFIDDDKEVIEYTVFTYSELYKATQLWCSFLRDLIYEYKDSGKIKFADFINDEEAFNKWKDGVINSNE